MFCNYSHKCNSFLVFHNDMLQANIHNKQIIFKANNKSTKKSAKICAKLTKTSKRHDGHCCGIPVVILTLVSRVMVPLIFKNVRRIKEVYNKCKSEKIPKRIQHPVIDLKMELLLKIVNDFKW